MFRKGIFILLSWVLLFSLVLPVNVSANPATYTDIDGHWGKEVIEDTSNKGLFTGYEGGRFAPEKNITRAEYITILYKALKQNGVNFLHDVGINVEMPYKDLDEDFWATPYIKAVFGLADFSSFGQGEFFYPNKPITRSEAAQITDEFVSFSPEADYVYFTDVEDRNLEFTLEQLVHKGILSGYEDNTFRPQNPIKRAEAAAIISRFYQWLYNDLDFEPMGLTAFFPATPQFTLMDSYREHNSFVDKQVKQIVDELQVNNTNSKVVEFADLVHLLYKEKYWNKAFVNYYEIQFNKDITLEEQADLLLEAAQFINEGGVDRPLEAGYEIYRMLYTLQKEISVMKKAAPYIYEWFLLVTEDITTEEQINSNDRFTDFNILLTAYWLIESGEPGKAFKIYENTRFFTSRNIVQIIFHNYLYSGLASGKITDGPSVTDYYLRAYALNGYNKSLLNLVAIDGAKLRRIHWNN